MNLLRLLALFFVLHAEGDAQVDPNADPDTGTDDLNVDLDAGDPDPDPAPQDEPEDPKAALQAERTAREAAERREREASERFQRELADARRGQPQQGQTQEDRLRAEEDRTLADPNATELQKWQVQSNRALRQSQQTSTAALFQSTDMADRTAFEQLATSKPAVYNRYKDEVDRRLQAARAQGANPSRRDILNWLIGQDAIDGKLGAKKAAPKAAPRTASVPRGQLPGARSDVRGNPNAMTNREKLAKKLENVQI